jgi:hypothetical protein
VHGGGAASLQVRPRDQAQPDQAAFLVARVVEDERKVGDLAGEDGLGPAGGDADADEIAEGVQDGRDAEAGKQEDEGMAEAEVVVDGAAA